MTWLRMPLAPIAVAFAAGIALAGALAPSIWWTIVALAAAGAALLARRHLIAAALLALLAVTALGAVRSIAPALPAEHVAWLALPRAAHLEGRLTQEPARWAPDRTRLVLEVERVDGEARTG